MGEAAIQFSRPLALALSPVLLVQGRAVRRTVPVLPEASGPRTGEVGDAGAKAYSVLVFGESTAAGVGTDIHEHGLAGGLARRLVGRHGRVHWAVTGRTGYTAGRAAEKLLNHVDGRFDLIVVLFGVNDALALTSTRRWSTDMQALIEGLRVHLIEHGRIILAGVPQVSSFGALPQPSRALLGFHARALDRRLGQLARRFVDVLHVPSPSLTDAAALGGDGFHPSKRGYELWAAHLSEAVASDEE